MVWNERILRRLDSVCVQRSQTLVVQLSPKTFVLLHTMSLGSKVALEIPRLLKCVGLSVLEFLRTIKALQHIALETIETPG